MPLGSPLTSFSGLLLGLELDCFGSLPLGMTHVGRGGSPLSSGLDDRGGRLSVRSLIALRLGDALDSLGS